MIKQQKKNSAEAHEETHASKPLAHEIEEARRLLDEGRSSAAEAKLTSVIEAAGDAPTIIGQARSLLSEALESRGRYREAFEVVSRYEAPEARDGLDVETSLQLRVRLGMTYNYTGDYPKAIAILNAALREATEHEGTERQRGAACTALARVYRSINEYTFARDYLQKALECYRHAGDWRGLCDVYFGFGLVDMLAGNQESALGNHEQALKLIGERAFPTMLGKIYTNMAGACWFLKRPHDGIRYLEQAIHYLERTEYQSDAALGYNNLGINLTLVGQWDRAHEALKHSLELAFEADRHGKQVPTILDSLGDLRVLMGELEEGRSLLERAVKLATEHGNKWYEGQARRTLGRCLLAIGDVARAREEGQEALSAAELIGDRNGNCESHLLLAEAHLRQGAFAECAEQLRRVEEQTTATVADLAITGAAQRVYGLLRLAQGDGTRAIHHFSRSVSIFEMLGDRYHSALAHYELGAAYAAIHQPERATEFLSHAEHAFRELGARLDLERAEVALATLGQEEAPAAATSAKIADLPALSPMLMLRLAEAASLRELLLRELAAVIRQETATRKVLIAEPLMAGGLKVVAAHGYSDDESARVLEALSRIETGKQGADEQVKFMEDAALMHLAATNAAPALLVIAPREAASPQGRLILDPLLRVAEMGLELCALRETARASHAAHDRQTQADQSLLPGFIHSSPAMLSLVDEINKIRSSDVTVLVTGESGTGKELVARAIHALSSRRDKVFIPFNCTAVPKELSESFLFGYRKGAFTGAVNDSPGVLRAASGGTLFLDEIGDLPLDLQPKLLRFLQEGEIQPLGEQRPVKVDVRVVAATNCDLEQMVAERRFREDLYYRLNVIRLRVPPLRERRSEIQPLVEHYVEHYAQKFKRRDINISPQAIDLLMVGDWPGNVRQLTNEIQRIVARAEDGKLITPQDLSSEVLPPATPPPAQVMETTDAPTVQAEPLPQGSLPDAIEHLERRMIADALQKHGNNISRAARDLGLTRRGLQLKLGRYGINTSAAA